MSAENGIGTAPRLVAVDEPEPVKRSGIQWPKGLVPFPRIKKPAETAQDGAKLREILSTLGEIAGITGISAGVWEIYPPAGLITAGVGVLALSLAVGIAE